jgi:Asp-tRNA(Asn)/Glu-tRNA(Gln) amidotransferase A subunit family amidase
MWDPLTGSLTLATLHGLYQSGALRPETVIDAIYSRIAARGDDHVWISLISRQEAMASAARLSAVRISSEALPPLWGLPFAIKDNIDLAGVPTTAACPAYTYLPDRSATVCAVATGPDPQDAYSRPMERRLMTQRSASGCRFGIPNRLDFLGDAAAYLFDQAVAPLEAMGGRIIAIDVTPFSEAGQLLYDGPWVAERLAALETFVRTSGDALHPITHQIIAGGAGYSAVDTFRAFDDCDTYERRPSGCGSA